MCADMSSQVLKKRVKRCRRWLVSVLGVSLLRLVSKRVPLSVNQMLGSALGGAVAVFKPRVRQVAQTNLAVCLPHTTAAERHEIIRRGIHEFGKLAFEVDYLWHAGASRIRALVTEVEGEEIRTRAEAGGNAIYATPHLGCWEMAGLYVALDRPLYCMYKQSPFDIVERFIRDGREAGGLKLCLSNTHGIRRLLRALADGENVGILPDQVPPVGYGVHAPFFGYPAYTMTLLAKLARRAPVVFVFAERLPRGHGYRICFTEPPPEIYDADPAVAATAVNKAVEHLVRRCPQQYYWAYKRFKRNGTKIYE